MATPNLKDRFLGCMYGLAIGDALGFPVEFMSLENIKRIFGENGVQGFNSYHDAKISYSHPIGSYSDDTQMSLATAQGIINAKTNKDEEVIQSICNEYVKWAGSPENDRAPGNTCMAGIANLKKGMHWEDSGILSGKGCGAAMRTAPIGLVFYNDIHKLANIARGASICTHADKTAASAGIGTAYLVAEVLRGKTPTEILADFKEFSGILNPDLQVKIKNLEKSLGEQDSTKAMNFLGQGWKGDEALALGLYCFLKNSKDYRTTVLMGTNTNGDSDSIASIAGAFSGAYNGIQGIPKEWIERIENPALLGETAERLYAKSGRF